MLDHAAGSAPASFLASASSPPPALSSKVTQATGGRGQRSVDSASNEQCDAKLSDTAFLGQGRDENLAQPSAAQTPTRSASRIVPTSSASEPEPAPPLVPTSAEIEAEADRTSESTPPSFAGEVPLGTFVTAKGHTLPTPSDKDLQDAKYKMERWERDDDCASTSGTSSSPRSSVQYRKKQLAPPSSVRSESPVVRSSLGLHSSISSSSISERSISVPHHPCKVPVAAFATPVRAVSASFSTGRKRDALNLPTLTPSRVTRPRISVPNASSTPRPSARRSLGVTRPSGSAKPAMRKAFKTPFKSGIRPAVASGPGYPSTPGPFADPVSPHLAHAGDVSLGTPSRKDICHAPGRLTLFQSGIRPESTSQDEATEHGCGQEIFTVLNAPRMAHDFEFLQPEDVTEGARTAVGVLQALGATDITLKWVRHHWGLILWKLAAMARHDPQHAARWWSWDTTVRQLRYRYEREINTGQRSALNRIKQHDSSAAQPMALCVYELEFGPPLIEGTEDNDAPGSAPEDQVLKVQPTLVLTDGWYTIRAHLDDPLFDALRRGRIRVGQKLFIFGAKCEGGPVEALDGFNTVSLHLHANGTQIAPWDTRLGFRPSPWVSSLRSMSPTGGKVGLIRIRITRVFDLGYLDANAKQRGAVHSASEEGEHQAQWERDRIEIREQLEQDWTDRLARSQEVVQAIASVLEHSQCQEFDSGKVDEDEILNRLFDASEPLLTLHRLCPNGKGLTLSVLHGAQARNEALKQEASHEILADLDERVPPRRIRTFRVVKFEDAIPAVPPAIPPGRRGLMVRQAMKARSSPRTAQLTVWDAAELESIRVGACFLVTGVYPCAPGSWRVPNEDAEVFLQTRQGSQWIPISDPDISQ